MNTDNGKGQKTSKKKVFQLLLIGENRENVKAQQVCPKSVEQYAIRTEYAANIAQALYKLRNEHFDLILLDETHGSEMTIKEVIETFRDCKIQVPVVIITGEGDERTVPKSMEGEAYRYITKDNLTTNLLEETIQTTLERYVQQAKHPEEVPKE